MRSKFYRIIVDGYDEEGGVFYSPSDWPCPIACDAEDVKNWQSLVVELRDGIYRHFNVCTGGANLISKEFKDILCLYIPSDYDVEFLPVKVVSKDFGDKVYYILHFTKIFNVIDKETTLYAKGIDVIIKVSLDYSKVKKLHLFNTQPTINDVIISEKVCKHLKKAGLAEGVEFVPIRCNDI